MDDKLDLFEFLKYVLDCDYISDLRTEPYNNRARLILDRLDLTSYSQHVIKDITEYINNKKGENIKCQQKNIYLLKD